jgi:hypothetical protein
VSCDVVGKWALEVSDDFDPTVARLKAKEEANEQAIFGGDV